MLGWRMIFCMSAKREPVTEDRLRNFKYFGKILPLLDRLHEAGTARDRAGNRILHFDQYIALQLLFFFNPVITSLRGLVQASHLRKVQQDLRVSPTSLGSLSEAASVFDADLLKPIIAELGLQLQPLTHDARLDDLPGALTAVDGTELTALAELVEAGWEGRGVKLHTHFEPIKGVPAEMDLTLADASEVDHLLAHLQPGRVYVKDRGYCCFRLFQAIVNIGSHFVCRARDNSVYQVIEDRPLSAAAKAAGVVSDQIVWLGSEGKRDELRQPLRLIQIACKPHRKRSGHTGRGGPEQGEVLLIVTSLLNVPAEVIALIYRKRWTVELFFRFFKYVLGCRHLLSHGANGIEIQVYLAIIVCMLIALWTGRKPTLRTIEMIRFYFIGWAELDELETHIAKLQPLPV
jgi:hypothetical protein